MENAFWFIDHCGATEVKDALEKAIQFVILAQGIECPLQDTAVDFQGRLLNRLCGYLLHTP
jgi:hypothetical protein